MVENIKDYTKEQIDEFSDIEKEAYDKANKLNKQLIHINILLEELDEDWNEYIGFLREKKISKICEFYGEELIPFDDELRESITKTLKDSLTDVQKSLNYNSKKISANRIVEH